MDKNELDGYNQYQKLIMIVRTFDTDAADYLEYDAPQLEKFIYSGYISSCFVWSETPQNNNYWADISKKATKIEEMGIKIDLVPDDLFEM